MNLFSDSKLIDLKIRQFLPYMLLSQVSTMLIVFADSLVVGNYVGSDGLSAINVAYPLAFILCIFSIIPQTGIMSRLVYQLGRSDARDTAICISAGKRLIVILAIALTIFQLPCLNEFCYKFNRRYFGDKLFDRLMIASVACTSDFEHRIYNRNL